MELFHNATLCVAIHARSAIHEKQRFSIHFFWFFPKNMQKPKKRWQKFVDKRTFWVYNRYNHNFIQATTGKNPKINALQRVGGGCEPTRILEYSSSPSFRENGTKTPSRFERISTVTGKVLQRHEWARLRQTEWYRGEILRLFYAYF